MRKLIIGATTAVAITLASCTPTAPSITDIIQAVQQNVVTACRAVGIFIPTAEAIAGIFLLGDPTLMAAEAIEAAIEAVLCPKAKLTSTGAEIKANPKVTAVETIKISPAPKGN